MLFRSIFCAAPSSNRIQANADPMVDLKNVVDLIKILSTVNSTNFILISTVDTQVKNTTYARCRRLLEEYVLTRPGSKIIRLCSLVGDNIKKNVLYDLKHNQYISQINFNDVCQWYPLNNLVDDISKTTQKEKIGRAHV